MSSNQQVNRTTDKNDNVTNMNDDSGVTAATPPADATLLKPEFRASISQQHHKEWMRQDFDNLTLATKSTASLTVTTQSTGNGSETTPFHSLNDVMTIASFQQVFIQKEDIGTRGKTDWTTMKPNDLKLFPAWFSVEKGSIATCPISNLPKVISNIQKIFYRLSLLVVYAIGSSNQPYAICDDTDWVRFHVTLWRNMAQELMVEVRYIGGESMLYHERQYQYLVLQAVRDSCEDTNTNQNPSSLTFSKIPMDPLLLDTKDREEQITAQESLKRRLGDRTSHEEQTTAIVERIEYYMCDDRNVVESVFEGFSILLNATNSNQSGYRIAETISKKLLTGTNMTSKLTLSLGLCESWYSDVELKIDDIRRDEAVVRDCSFLALRIIGQAVNLLDKESMELFVANAKSILEIDSFAAQSPLYKHIEHADEKPHVAYCAAHILARVCETVSDVRLDFQKKREIVPCIQKAVTFGSSNHVSLELASKRLLSVVSTI